jgi:serine protease Do
MDHRSRLVAALAAVVVGAASLPPLPVFAEEAGPRSVADLAEGLLGSVVNISTSQRVEGERPRAAPTPPGQPDGGGSGSDEGGGGDTPFREFFDEFFDRENRVPDPRRVQSLGSGFVVSADGVVITNNHVIKDADEVTVNFADGRKYVADVVGFDPKTDIAVLRIHPEEPLKPLEFAASDHLRVGDWVMAIGNPFGLGGTVTVGIISARNRNLQSGPYDDFLQTDAAINRGNSGGPLFDMNGKVVGINTAIISPTGGSIGIGFAIPSEIATNVIEQLLQYGETRRGWLGVRIQEVSEDIADSLGMDRPKGAMIAGVTPDGPAEKGGIRAGDVVVTFDGRDIPTMRELPRYVAESPIGKKVKVTVLREGAPVELEVELGQLEETEARATPAAVTPEATRPETPPAERMSLLGMTLSPLGEAERAAFKIDNTVTGVLVAEVEDGSRAAEKRVAAGDVILEVGQRPVASPQDVMTRIDELKADGRNTALLTLSNAAGELRFTALRLAD